MRRADSLEAAGQFVAARRRLHLALEAYPDSVSEEDLEERLAILDSFRPCRV